MQEAANDDRALIDLDDIEEIRAEARRAKVRRNAQRYIGLPNLLDVATATYIELRREEAELHAAATRDYRSEAERTAATRWVRPTLARIDTLQDDLAAMLHAMDGETLAKYDAAIEALPSPAELVAGR